MVTCVHSCLLLVSYICFFFFFNVEVLTVFTHPLPASVSALVVIGLISSLATLPISCSVLSQRFCLTLLFGA